MSASRLFRVVSLLAAGALASAGAAPAQSLADIAAKQKEKRKGKTKVYTEEDLRRGGTTGYSPTEVAVAADGEEAAAPAPAAAPGAPAARSEEEQRADQSKIWRDKLQKSRENVTQLTAETNRLQTALNDLTQPVYGSTRAARIAALEKAKQQLAAAEQAVTDLEEEGRRNGYR
jgi:hypothetical protein